MDDQIETPDSFERFVVLYLNESHQEEISEPTSYQLANERAKALKATGFQVLSVATEEYGRARMEYNALPPEEKDEWLKNAMQKGLHGVLPAFGPSQDGMVTTSWENVEMPTPEEYDALEKELKESRRAVAVRDEWQTQQFRHQALDWALRLAEINNNLRAGRVIPDVVKPLKATDVVTQARVFERYLRGITGAQSAESSKSSKS